MATRKKPADTQDVQGTASPQSAYDTSGLDSRQQVENAMAGAVYRPGQSVTDAADALKQWQDKRPEDYQSSYQDRIEDLLGQLNSRQEFRYNYTQDPLYRQYQQLYTQNAHNASADAAAQAAALTGGYGSSYAASAAQQAYQQQIGALNSAIPTLYSLALDTYTSGGDQLVTQLDQLASREQNEQNLYNQKLSDYYTQLQQKGSDYNDAYAKDYGEYQDYLSRLNTLYGYYSSQEQAQAARRQQTFSNIMTVLGVIGDAVQLAISGTTGIGSLAGSLINTGYGIYANNRDYQADRADTAWNQQMQDKLRQDDLTQQQYQNEQAERAYQDALRQQAFDNEVTTERLNIAKGEWALKQTAAQQRASRGASAASSSGGSSSGSGSIGSTRDPSLLAGGTGTGSGGTSGSVDIPYTATLMRRQGKDDTAISLALRSEGYTSAQIGRILQALNR